MAKIVFKELTSNQNVLFPVSLSEKIAPNHPVRVVNSVVDALDISCLLWAYKGGGTSSYHPRMMLKVLFYAYLNNIYSCRKIEKALQENIHFMWLSGNSTPDFRTINDFRGKRLKEHIKSLFSAIVLLLQESGYVSLDVQYIDGTKVESASNATLLSGVAAWKRTRQNWNRKYRQSLVRLTDISNRTNRKGPRMPYRIWIPVA